LRQEELADSVIVTLLFIIHVAPIWALFLALFSAIFATGNLELAGERL
jgi:hypothetical protein